VREREIQRTRDRERILGTSIRRHEERESKSKRTRESESERAREREREKEREGKRKNLSSVFCGHVGKRGREETHRWSFVDTIPQRMSE